MAPHVLAAANKPVLEHGIHICQRFHHQPGWWHRLHPQLLWRWQYTRELADITNGSLDTETLENLRVGPTKTSWCSVSSSRKFCCGAESPNTLVQAGKMNTDLSKNDLAVTVDAGMNMGQLSLQVRQTTDWAAFGGVWKTDQEEPVTPSTQCWWCHVWNTRLPFGSTFGYVEKPERAQ